MMTTAGTTGLGTEAADQHARLLALRTAVADERRTAVSPAVARALELADMQLFLALTYLGHTAELFPDEVGPGDVGA
jgi:hypothetical protein